MNKNEKYHPTTLKLEIDKDGETNSAKMGQAFNPYPANIFVLKMFLLHIFKCTSDLILSWNPVNPDQTAPSDSVPQRFFLKKIVLKEVNRQQQKHEKLPCM